MYRIIFKIGPFSLYSYGLMMAIAFVAALFTAAYFAKVKGIERERIVDLATWIIIGAIVGARAWFVIENFQYFTSDLMGILRIWEGGMVFYGGFVGGALAGLYYVRKNKLSLSLMADIIAPGFALGISIGRIGCFLNGCCYGALSNTCGISYPAKDFPPAYYQQLHDGLIQRNAAHSLPVIPTQLIASMAAFIIFIGLYIMMKKHMKSGIVFSTFMITYGIDRFIVDFFRHYSEDAMKLGIFSFSQWTSLCLILGGGILFYLIYRRNKQRPLEQRI